MRYSEYFLQEMCRDKVLKMTLTRKVCARTRYTIKPSVGGAEVESGRGKREQSEIEVRQDHLTARGRTRPCSQLGTQG